MSKQDNADFCVRVRLPVRRTRRNDSKAADVTFFDELARS
jgi:hypothetical protein